MDSQPLKVLEFDKVLALIARETVTLYGAEFIHSHAPYDNSGQVLDFQRRVTEMKKMFERRILPPLVPLSDIRNDLSRTEKGFMLSSESLWNIGVFLKTVRVLKDFLKTHENTFQHFKMLQETLAPQASFERKIFESVSDSFEILDTASLKLGAIRRRLQNVRSELQQRLQALMQTPAILGFLQEPIIIQRSGRYVVPVKDIYIKQFKGILHDRSASGATAFMEPLAIVDFNNQALNAQLEEKEEEEAILRLLSSSIGSCAPDLQRSIHSLAEVDGVYGAASWSVRVNGMPPQVNDSPVFDFVGARHPLLGDTAVPINAELGKKFRTLVITGPNTGGKTVSLKTVGLFCMLAQCGFHLPVENASVGMLKNIFADIGDEQSIEQNLSTFSGHLQRILAFLSKADENTLVLLDELGAGTDPREGAALAMALLQYFHERGGLTVATTHYPEVKAFAENTPGMCNASMRFNEETLSPSYQLDIGQPGRSLALVIATKLGVPASIVESAKQLMDRASLSAEEFLESLQRKEREFEKAYAELEAEREAFELQKAQADALQAPRAETGQAKSPPFAPPQKTSEWTLVSTNTPSEIRVLGMHVDEAIAEVEKYLDRGILSSQSTLRLVHGKGKGILRNAIHELLKTHPLVQSFRVGALQEGGDGVTIVTLK